MKIKKTVRLIALAFLSACATSGTGTTSSPTYPILASGSAGTNRPDQLAKPYVVLVSFDGFRGDYLDHYTAPNFQRFARQGVRATGLIPGFPSKTFPNHISIVTGQYPGTHGIVANTFFDPQRNETYSIGQPKTVNDGSWYKGEPIWVTAEKQGMVTESYFWVGSEAAIEGVRPSHTKAFPDSSTKSERVDSVLTWLKQPAEQRPHLVMLYMSDVDGAGHRYGPDDPHVQTAILAVDSALGRLMDGIQTLPFHDQVYVVLVSDHGMMSYTPQSAVTISSLIDTAGIRTGDVGPNAHFYISTGPEQARIIRDSLNRHLQHGRAYLRSEIPARLHYNSDPRGGDVVVIMDEHYQIVRRIPTESGGNHGWDPKYPSMYGIFLVEGPGIKSGATIAPFENVQIYPFLAEILGLKSAPGVEGETGWLRQAVMR